MNLQDGLRELGLRDKEVWVYMALLKTGRLTPAELAGATKINRATVYATAKQLIAKNLIAEDLGGKRLTLVALPPEKLSGLTRQQREDLKRKDGLIADVIKEIQLMSAATRYPVPKIRFIEEDKIEDYLYSEAPKWNQSAAASDNTWWGFQDADLIAQYEKWLHWLWSEVHKGTEVKLFSNVSRTEEKLKNKYLKRKIKALTDGRFTATTWVVGDYLVMVATSQHPHYLVEIHDVLLASNMREVFRALWDKTP